MSRIDINICRKEDLLRCYRNELVPANTHVDKFGVEGLLKYRSNKNKRHPDSALTHKNTSWISKELYGCIPESQDTIFNCWAMIKIYDAVHQGLGQTRNSKSILSDIENGIEIILPKHITEFNMLADRQHCIANFMPAPKGFNGWRNRYRRNPGKGEYYKDNDFPDIYYARAKVEFPKMYHWINQNMERYSLDLFSKRITPWENKKANFKAMPKKPTEEQLYEIVKKMNLLLDERADSLLKRRVFSD